MLAFYWRRYDRGYKTIDPKLGLSPAVAFTLPFTNSAPDYR